MVRGLQTMHRGDQWWVAPAQQEVPGACRRREGELFFANGLSDSWQVPPTCVWESSPWDQTAILHEKTLSLGWWRQPVRIGLGTGRTDWHSYSLSVSLYLFMHLSYGWNASLKWYWLNDNRINPLHLGSKRTALFSLEIQAKEKTPQPGIWAGHHKKEETTLF